MHIKRRKLWLAMMLALPMAAPVWAQDATDEDEEAKELDTLQVTGSRLEGGDPTVRTYTITAEEIKSRGLSSAEEVIRSMPFVFSSINNTTNMNIDQTDTNLGALGLGISSVNLRGLGSRATLVLVNGRRVAGTAGNQEGFVNINNIPVAAIERVEVQLEGASAVYGSDAVGGVVNFILYKDFDGGRVQARYENSSTDADRVQGSAMYGFGWGSGNFTANISYTENDPVNNAKTGWTTRDYSDEFGPEFDYRDYSNSYSGVVSFDGRWGPFLWTLGPDHDGVGATPEDFMFNQWPLDQISPENGATTEEKAVTLFFEQNITDNIMVYADLLWSENESDQEFQVVGVRGIEIPETNAFNPFGMPVWVNYTPFTEAELGMIPRSATDNTSEALTFNVGFEWAMGNNELLSLNYNYSKTESESAQYRPDGYDRTDPRIWELLSSSDPNVALNFFGNGTAQNPGIDLIFGTVFGDKSETEITSLEPVFRGTFDNWDLGAGGLSYAIGAEFREEELGNYDTVRDEISYPDTSVGVPPVRDLTAYFVEVSYPFFGPENAVKGIDSLIVTVAARYDEYEMDGAFGTIDDIPEWAGGQPNIIKASFDNTSPKFGIAYAPIPELRFHASWNEAFTAPTFTDLFTTSQFEFVTSIFDPYSPNGPELVFVPHSFTSNPDLEPEVATTKAFGFSWTPEFWPGFAAYVDWSEVDYEDRIAHGSNVKNSLPPEEFAKLDEYVKRGPDGHITHVLLAPMNQTARVSEILTIDLSYTFDTSWGTWTPGFNYTDIIEEYDQFTPDTPPVDNVGTSRGNDDYQWEARLRWATNNYGADLYVNYIPEYDNISNIFYFQGEQYGEELDVDDYLTVDLTGFYDFNNGLTLRFGGRNIFDEDFPYTVKVGQPYDASRVDLRGRVWFLDLMYDF